MQNAYAINKFFSGTDEAVLPFHLTSFREASYQEGDIIVNGEAASCQNIYLVLGGKVRVIYPDASRRFLVFEDIEGGDFFGAEGALTDTGKMFYVSALENSKIAVVHAESLKALLADPRIAHNLLKKLSASLSELKTFGFVKRHNRGEAQAYGKIKWFFQKTVK